VARQVLGLPAEGAVVLFGAESAGSDSRKGFDFVRPALETLRSTGSCDGAQLVVFGASEIPSRDDYPFEVHELGRLRDDVSLKLAYSAADVFLCPSREDNLPNTVLEAMACGTPTVAFRVGGFPDMIDHLENGYLADPFSSSDFGNGISRVLERAGPMSQISRARAERDYSLDLQAHRYISLFEDLVRETSQSSSQVELAR
jgi:glycosyltransferase involved in cell wall biosynthesis